MEGRGDPSLAARVCALVGASVGAATLLAITVTKIVRRERRRRAPLRLEDWESALDDEGRPKSIFKLIETVRLRGVEPALKGRIWPFLLGVYPLDSTQEDRLSMYESLAGQHRQLLNLCEELESNLIRRGGGDMAIPSVNTQQSSQPGGHSLTAAMQFEEAQRIIVLDAVRTEMAPLQKLRQESQSGIPDSLLGTPGSSQEEPPSPGSYTGGIEGMWNGHLGREMVASSTHLSSYAQATASRLISLLSAYAAHDPEIGYCQGMADLAVPFVALITDNVEAFWCFERLMRTARRNFLQSGEGVKSNLRSLSAVLEQLDPVLMHHLRHVGAGECLFAYRMSLVMMRRELSLSNCLLLWEMLWAESLAADLASPRENGSPSGAPQPPHDPDSSPDLFTCFMAEVVHAQRRRILDDAVVVDDVLRLFSSYHINLWRCIRGARSTCLSLSSKHLPG